MHASDGYHHLTACVGGAQEDLDFYVNVLGQKLIKQTVLMDGSHGVYHLYYGNEQGAPGTIVTSFPYAQRGIVGKRGTGQIKTISYSVPSASIEFWCERLARAGVPHARSAERFGQRYLSFEHPSGIELEMVAEDGDARDPWVAPEIGRDNAIRGVFGVTVSLRETAHFEAFVKELGFGKSAQDGQWTRFVLGPGGANRTLDVIHQPDVPAGTWTYAAGTIHHCAFAVNSEAEQEDIREALNALGHVDVSEIKDRRYFRSIYVRTPGGPLLEFATNGPGFTVDEPADQIGAKLLLPPWFEDRSAEILAELEPIVPPFSNAA